MTAMRMLAERCAEVSLHEYGSDNDDSFEDPEVTHFNQNLMSSGSDKYPRTSTPLIPNSQASTAVPKVNSFARRLFLRQLPGKPRTNAPKKGYLEISLQESSREHSSRIDSYARVASERHAYFKELQKKYGTNQSVQDDLLRSMTDAERNDWIRRTYSPERRKAEYSADSSIIERVYLKLKASRCSRSPSETLRESGDGRKRKLALDTSSVSNFGYPLAQSTPIRNREIKSRAHCRIVDTSSCSMNTTVTMTPSRNLTRQVVDRRLNQSWFIPKKPQGVRTYGTIKMRRREVAHYKIKEKCEEKYVRFTFGTSTEADFDETMPDGKAPHFPQQPVARQNDDGSLELECFVDANPTPQVKWYYDNKEVENSGRFSANLANKGSDSYSAILTIKELADADAGAYRCAIVNPHGKGNANFNLKLTGFSSPTFVEKPQISSRDDGQVMVMEFRAKSILEPTFVWQKLVGGGAEEIIANSDRIKAVKKLEAGNVYYSALEIKEPTKDKDAGQFICTVKNESGKLTATFTVKFEVPEGAPSFTRKPQILQQTSSGGEPAICFDIGYSARLNPQVTWISPKSKKMKESSRIKFKTNDEGNGNFTAQLELTNYKAKDSGTYTCNIKNDAGEANVELTLNIEGPLDDYADDSEN